MVFNQSEYYKKWRQANKEKMAAYMREYRENNPDYVKQDYKRNNERRMEQRRSEKE